MRNTQHGSCNSGFTLIELLIVIAIILILIAIALPNMMEVQIRAKVARAKAELKTIMTSLETYQSDHHEYPPARTYCAGMNASIEDYNIIPPELTSPILYIHNRYWDVFNKDHPYKYIRPGRGWANNTGTILALWVPRHFPEDMGPDGDIPYFHADKSPVKCAVWSVGPSGPLPFYESDASHLPVPPRTWYSPTNGTTSSGVITIFNTGHHSP